MLFRMVPKQKTVLLPTQMCFRAVLFRMVPKLTILTNIILNGFRAVLFRMVPTTLCNDFHFTYPQTHLIIEESSIEMGEETCYTNIQRFSYD